AVTSARRHPQLPDVPTMGESGIADFVMTFWSGVVAPAGTPEAVTARLNAAIDQGLRSPQMRESLGKVGSQADPGSREDFGRFIAAETEKWAAVARTAGIAAE